MMIVLITSTRIECHSPNAYGWYSYPVITIRCSIRVVARSSATTDAGFGGGGGGGGCTTGSSGWLFCCSVIAVVVVAVILVLVGRTVPMI